MSRFVMGDCYALTQLRAHRRDDDLSTRSKEQPSIREIRHARDKLRLQHCRKGARAQSKKRILRRKQDANE
jgi:hypothetical protein